MYLAMWYKAFEYIYLLIVYQHVFNGVLYWYWMNYIQLNKLDKTLSKYIPFNLAFVQYIHKINQTNIFVFLFWVYIYL